MVSLGLVGEVFEVRTQVDRDLTTVSKVDRPLRLIKTWSITASQFRHLPQTALRHEVDVAESLERLPDPLIILVLR
jgi:hypothetical protein